jgi:hypothetical protein
MILVYIRTVYLFKTHFNIILPFTLRFLKWCLPIRFPEQNFAYISHLYNVLHAPLIIPMEEFVFQVFMLEIYQSVF